MDLSHHWFLDSIPTRVDNLTQEVEIIGGRTVRTAAKHFELIDLLRQQNEELRLRLGVLIRLLVEQGTLTAEQFSDAVNETKAALEAARTPAPKKPTAVPKAKPPGSAKLPKPPKLALGKQEPPTTT